MLTMTVTVCRAIHCINCSIWLYSVLSIQVWVYRTCRNVFTEYSIIYRVVYIASHRVVSYFEANLLVKGVVVPRWYPWWFMGGSYFPTKLHHHQIPLTPLRSIEPQQKLSNNCCDLVQFVLLLSMSFHVFPSFFASFNTDRLQVRCGQPGSVCLVDSTSGLFLLQCFHFLVECGQYKPHLRFFVSVLIFFCCVRLGSSSLLKLPSQRILKNLLCVCSQILVLVISDE